jgi:hypothetical protein
MQQNDKPASRPPPFASEADRQAWMQDFIAFGMATLDEDGRHVPLSDMLKPATQMKRVN